MPASEVLTSLIEWYNVEADEDATPQQEAFLKRHRRLFRVRSIRCILLWIKHHWYDFHNDPQLLEELVNFVADVSETSFGDGQKMTQAIRESRLSWYMTQYIPPFSNRRAAPSEAFKPWALRWEAEAFAEQLTLIDSHLFRQIRPDAYLHLLQMPLQAADLRESAAFKAIMDYVSWFRLVSAYCATLIVKEDNVKKRTKAIRRFIKIAKICRELNNYNTLFAVMHGLKRPAVHKLSPAWEAVPAKYLETFRSMEELMNPEDGYAAYWTALKATKPPAIPFFGLYLMEMSFMSNLMNL
ncbi:ras guanine nucleotide exchange factor domain-containing protein [Zopfochytrium polystomum]|nr:ras guanine nucleotide exchange factor domain-containing protein [Zopfochytrium polystomum]